MEKRKDKKFKVHKTSFYFEKTFKQFEKVYEQNLYQIYSWLAILRKYDYLLEYENENYLDNIMSKHIGDFEGLAYELRKIKNDHDFILRNIP